jgi:lia operon protein LiaG
MEEEVLKKLGYGLLFFIVVLLSGIGFIFYTEGADAFSTKVVELHEEQSITGKTARRISIKSNSTDLVVLPHAKDEIVVELKGEISEKMENAFKLTVTEHNDLVKVEVDRNTRSSFTVFAINKGTYLTVLVPEKIYEGIVIEASSGDIRAADLTAKTITLKATSGDMSGENLTGSSQLSFETTSGDIESLHSKANEMIVQATSGDVMLDMEQHSYSVDFKGGEGKVNVPGFLFEEMSEERILGKKGEEGLAIFVRTTSGDFELNE